MRVFLTPLTDHCTQDARTGLLAQPRQPRQPPQPWPTSCQPHVPRILFLRTHVPVLQVGRCALSHALRVLSHMRRAWGTLSGIHLESSGAAMPMASAGGGAESMSRGTSDRRIGGKRWLRCSLALRRAGCATQCEPRSAVLREARPSKEPRRVQQGGCWHGWRAVRAFSPDAAWTGARRTLRNLRRNVPARG